jgi:hypothetical protein
VGPGGVGEGEGWAVEWADGPVLIHVPHGLHGSWIDDRELGLH